MYVLKNQRSGVWISVKDFVLKYKDVIEVFKKVKTVDDIIKIIIDDINKDRLLEKEFRRSILKKEDIIDFFVNNHVRKELEKIHAINFFGKWFNILTTSDIFPPGLDIINIILDISTGSIMDVYAVSRMFKIFDVKKTEFYPREPRNIIYYAGNGHTIPMFKFLEKLSFSTVEKANSDVLSSCVNMKNIKQPLFS